MKRFTFKLLCWIILGVVLLWAIVTRSPNFVRILPIVGLAAFLLAVSGLIFSYNGKDKESDERTNVD